MSICTALSFDDFYISHHAVIKEESATTKTRIVFDGSAETTSGKSLNDVLMTGPTIQDDLFTLLLRFRSHNYVITADIEKMYRQFLVRPEDRKYQKVLWQIEGEIKEFTLNTVTFGLTSSPYLAIRCLHRLAEDEKHNFPEAARVLKKDLYVDNILTGVRTINEGRNLCKELTQICQTAKLNLRQWASNDISILHDIPKEYYDKNFQLHVDNPLKTLGIYWNAKTDSFVYSIKRISLNKKFTKRSILSEIAKIFDPIGLLGPIILTAKKVMQEIWQAKSDWDESVPMSIHESWSKYCTQLNSIDKVIFQRKIFIRDACEIQLHGFCDASELGYGACFYFRTKDKRGNYQTTLLCSKSRVAPLKSRSLPRLELCGAQLLAKLYRAILNTFNIQIDKTYFWCDSTITLHWINSASHILKCFVANRVTDIQLKTNKKSWRHIRSKDNPADALSRGQMPVEFLQNQLWLTGPTWLRKNETKWPFSKIPNLDDIPEKRTAICLLLNSIPDFFNKFSSFNELKRVIAWCLRVKKIYRNTGLLTSTDLQRAEFVILRLVQKCSFKCDYSHLSIGEPVNEKSRLLNFDPFIDSSGLIRVGGRLRKAMIPFVRKHPIILPHNNYISDLIIKECHQRNFHAGAQTTLYNLRQKYWLIDGRNQVRRVIRKCVTCFRAKPEFITYKMGDLPKVRTMQARPFCNVGVDFCGPFYIKEKKHRNRSKVKSYVAIFICMVVKAIHIEIVSDLTTEGFLAAFKRFSARRGVPQRVYSDNASNFTGAKNELMQLYALFQSEKHKSAVKDFALTINIDWHFIPPHAPNFGGLWESNVKQFKNHFKRVISKSLLTFEQLNTFAIEAEAILNSRPLTPMSQDPNDLEALTPGDFLIGEPMNCTPDINMQDIPDNRLSLWQFVSKQKKSFWDRWHKEYINELILRRKKNVKEFKLEQGSMVIVKEDNLPCMQWPLGRIIDTHPGADKVIRAVTIKTATGSMKRPTSKIAILPIEN